MRLRHKPVTKFFPEGQTVFAQCTRTVKRTIILTESFFLQKFLVDTMEAILKFSLDWVWKKTDFFPFIDRKRWKKFLFSNSFSSKNPYRQVAYNFDNPVERKKTEVQKRQSMTQTNEWKNEFLTNFCSENVFMDRYLAVLTTTLRKYRQKTDMPLLHV